ncbi:hypothetical protein FE782_18150 [Paenibacillus antri]|uniref:Uncharacterized protein n=1 Tax=Paenibacillus antri TaxID=2582848 RepID=A0A5R9G7B3_9BACL|nr:hypothetical protein [Paenibacillus antri]TLS50969.1 hypothetical protein FE782_18150 [Paenibacillus antri]
MTLQEIQEIQLESCHQHVGSPVCAVLRDGTHVYGILGGLHDGKLILHRAARGPGKLAVSSAKAKRALRAKTKAFGYGPYYPGAYAVDAALVALLFTLPFLFI